MVQKTKYEEQKGIDDASIGMVYRFPRNKLSQAIRFRVTLDNASDSEGQVEQ